MQLNKLETGFFAFWLPCLLSGCSGLRFCFWTTLKRKCRNERLDKGQGSCVDACLPAFLADHRPADVAGDSQVSHEQARYSIGTWDTNRQAFTPQRGLSVPSFNATRWQLRQAMKELRQMGYSVHRFRGTKGDHEDNDPFVLIERTDGKHWKQIRKGWQR